jgi:excisionase family DNA binding protein
MMQPLETTSSAARILGVTPQTVISYVRAGRLSGSLIGREYRFQTEDLLDFVNGAKTARKK